MKNDTTQLPKEGDVYPEDECPTCGNKHRCPLCKGKLTYSEKNKHYCCSDCCSVCRRLYEK